MRLKSPVIFAALSALSLFGCLPKPIPTIPGNPDWGVDVTWHGHSCFTFKDSTGRTLAIDPFDDTVGYGHLSLRADALLITHEHFDHNEKRAVRARSRDVDLFESTGTDTVAGGVAVTGIDSFHDKVHGKLYGPNKMYSFMMGGLRFVHMGDFGQDHLTEVQTAMMGKVDVLMIPVGGFTTLGPKEAKEVVDHLKPRVVFPMHYGDIRFYKLADVKEFANLFPKDRVHYVQQSTVRIRQTELSSDPGLWEIDWRIL
jgi:L-ascorbate metabolism protein UlaG (beta-lactamase superfamily)